MKQIFVATFVVVFALALRWKVEGVEAAADKKIDQIKLGRSLFSKRRSALDGPRDTNGVTPLILIQIKERTSRGQLQVGAGKKKKGKKKNGDKKKSGKSKKKKRGRKSIKRKKGKRRGKKSMRRRRRSRKGGRKRSRRSKRRGRGRKRMKRRRRKHGSKDYEL